MAVLHGTAIVLSAALVLSLPSCIPACRTEVLAMSDISALGHRRSGPGRRGTQWHRSGRYAADRSLGIHAELMAVISF